MSLFLTLMDNNLLEKTTSIDYAEGSVLIVQCCEQTLTLK